MTRLKVKQPIHVERKTAATAVGALPPALAVGVAAGSHPVITGLDALPPYVQAIVAFIVTYVIPVAAAYMAPHTDRSADLDAGDPITADPTAELA